MSKKVCEKDYIIELPKRYLGSLSLKKDDILRVKLIGGKEIILEKPKSEDWDELFKWGKSFAKEKNIKSKDITQAIKELRKG